MRESEDPHATYPSVSFICFATVAQCLVGLALIAAGVWAS